MKITDIQVTRDNLKLTRPYSIAYKTVDSVENVFVTVTLENGMVGIGAANPSKYVVGEDVNDTMATLSEGFLATFIGRDIRRLNKLCEDLFLYLPDRPGARAALDIAFHDVFAQVLGIPLVQYLGQQIPQMATSVTIGIKDVAETLAEAEEYAAAGFKILKVKLGNDLDEDIERLVKLRERFADRMKIRVDANQGYDTRKVLTFYEETRALDIELIEQPVKADMVEEMRELPANVRKKIAADESLVSAEDAMRLVLPSPACGIFNIKLMKCGGIYQARRIAEVARLAGIALMWGCNDESIVSITAALHVAFSSSHTQYIDLDGSFDLAADRVTEGFELTEGEMKPVLSRPGLGVQRI